MAEVGGGTDFFMVSARNMTEFLCSETCSFLNKKIRKMKRRGSKRDRPPSERVTHVSPANTIVAKLFRDLIGHVRQVKQMIHVSHTVCFIPRHFGSHCGLDIVRKQDAPVFLTSGRRAFIDATNKAAQFLA